MKNLKRHALNVGITMSLITFTSHECSAATQELTPVLDGYAYTLTGNISIDLTNQIVRMESNIINCEQANGDPPLDTVPLALFTNSQFIGLSDFRYNITQGRVYFDSETNDLICDNGSYVDTLFVDGFDGIYEDILFADGFD